jgi:hypothetical protein
MTPRTGAVRFRPLAGVDLTSLTVGAALIIACLVMARLLTEPRDLRLAIAAAALALIAGLGVVSPPLLLYGLVAWLTVLGVLRRGLNTFTPTPHTDVLLLVGPAAIAVLFALAANRGAFRHRSRLSTAVIVLNVLAILGAFNPLQGPIATGLAGLLFVLVPTLAFWIGRGLCGDHEIATVLKLFALLGVAVAIYGLVQTFAGFPSWDQAWIAQHRSDYLSITVEGTTRAFASFSAASEYAAFLAVAFVVWVGFGLTPVFLPITAAALGMLGVAIFYEGIRGVVVLVVIALAMMAGVRSRVPLIWAAALAACLVVLIPFVTGHIVGSANNTSYSTPLVARQVNGLQSPTNSSSSTLNEHIKLLKQGIHSAIARPIGQGTGAVTIASSKFGGITTGKESDPGNAAVAFGFVGLIVYLVIAVEGLRRTYRLALQRRGWLAPTALAILVVMGLQWLNGGQYAVAFLPWLLLGWADRSHVRVAAMPIAEGEE